MTKVLLDTSFVVKCVEFKIDMFEEVKRAVPFIPSFVFLDRSLEELQAVALQGGKEKQRIKIAKLFFEKAKKVVTMEKGHVDDILLGYAKKNKAILATQDTTLKKRAKEQKIPLVYIRQKKYVKYEEW